MPLEMTKNAFYLMSKTLFFFDIFKGLSWLVGYVQKQFDCIAKNSLKIYDVIDCTTNNYNTHITQYLK